jgi:tripartite-type tricarboxylate transporter receptor subunit TctC
MHPWLLFAATLAAAGLSSAAAQAQAQAQAQDWPPSAAVRVIVPFAAGGPVDVPSRLMNERLSAQTSTFILENRVARAAPSAHQVAQAAPDGQTLLFTLVVGDRAGALLKSAVHHCVHRDQLIAEVPIVLMVRGNSPIRTLAEYLPRPRPSPARSVSAAVVSAPAITCRASCSRS